MFSAEIFGKGTKKIAYMQMLCDFLGVEVEIRDKRVEIRDKKGEVEYAKVRYGSAE